MPIRLITLTLLSLLAISGNSLLCRLALKETSIDPTTFIMFRLLSGAVVLWLVLVIQNKLKYMEGSWFGAWALFAYAITFAFAYVAIPAGTGALLLFAAIQISMIVYGLIIGERLSFVQGVGLLFSMGGLVLLMLPSLGAPPLLNALFMIFSGISWGVYSILGRKAKDPINATAGNFIRAAPITIALFLAVSWQTSPSFDGMGIVYALISGAITSGLGYILWYSALKELNVTHAATVQLSVPVITAFGGSIFLNEEITMILVIASIAIVVGISLVVFTKKKTASAVIKDVDEEIPLDAEPAISNETVR
ncbi:DMT family transporter [bacterium]|nr:DMT family transporter [bacterium]